MFTFFFCNSHTSTMMTKCSYKAVIGTAGGRSRGSVIGNIYTPARTKYTLTLHQVFHLILILIFIFFKIETTYYTRIGSRIGI